MEKSSRVKPSMISSFATAVHALWMVDTIIYVDAETLEIGKDCPKWKRWKTTAH